MKLAVLFDHFGPYHIARLRAAAALDQVVGLEFAARSGDYAWDLAERAGVSVETLGCIGDLGAHLVRLRPEVVAIPGWSSRGALSALLWCLDHHVPAVLMSESTAHDEPRRFWKEAVKRRVVRLFGAALAGGSAHATYLVRLGVPESAICLGYDAVDNRHFAPRAGGAAAHRHGFLASARFIEKKNLPRLLRAYARYRTAAPTGAPWTLTILGDGPLRPDLEGLVAELGVQAEVSLPGFKQYEDLPEHYAAAAVFVHASTSEQWGLVVNEAMASGMPVLVSERCGCAPDLVRSGINGYTFDPENIDALAALMTRMAQLSEGERCRMGEASLDIIARWAPDRFAKGLHAAAEQAKAGRAETASGLDRTLLKWLANR